MPTEIKLPALGENVDSGTVVKILVSVGDTVTEDQPVLENHQFLEKPEVCGAIGKTVSGRAFT